MPFTTFCLCDLTIPRYLGFQYEYANGADRNFYERFTRGEKTKAVWVRPDDFEKNFDTNDLN